MGRSKRASASHGGAQGAAASAPSMATGTQFSTAGHIDTGKRRASRNGAVVFAIVVFAVAFGLVLAATQVLLGGIGLGALVEILPQFGSDNLVGIDHQHPFARRTLDGKGAGWFCTHAVALGIGHDLAAIALGNLYGTVGRFHVADHDLVEVLDCFETLGQVALGVISVDDY
jgi:hypothetical protein